MTNIDLEQRVHELELRLAAAESMTDILVNEARKQRGLEPIGWEQMRADAKAAVDDTLATVLGAPGMECNTAPSLSEQLQEAQATIERVRALIAAAEQAPLRRLAFMLNSKPFPATVGTDELRDVLDGPQ